MKVGILLFQQIMIFFFMIGMGAILVASGRLKSEDSKVLSLITIYLVLPCVIIHSFQISFTNEIAYRFAFSLFLALLVHILFLLLIHIGSNLFHYTNIEKATILYSNAGNMIIPIISILLGEEWIIYSSAFIAVQLLFLWTHGNQILSNRKKLQWKSLFQNINMIAIILGIIFFFLHINLPDIINQTLISVGNLLAPLSMFISGMLIVEIDFKKAFMNKRIYHICFMRLLICPCIFLFLMYLIGIPNQLEHSSSFILFITFIATMTPASSTIIQIAQINDQDASYASTLNCVSTLLCCISMPIMVMLYNYIYQLF